MFFYFVTLTRPDKLEFRNVGLIGIASRYYIIQSLEQTVILIIIQVICRYAQ